MTVLDPVTVTVQSELYSHVPVKVIVPVPVFFLELYILVSVMFLPVLSESHIHGPVTVLPLKIIRPVTVKVMSKHWASDNFASDSS